MPPLQLDQAARLRCASRCWLLACAALVAAACGDGGTEPSASATATATATPASTAATIGLLDELPLEVDQQAPDFFLRTLNGRSVRLSDYRGKTVVLNFWASWCRALPPRDAGLPDAVGGARPVRPRRPRDPRREPPAGGHDRRGRGLRRGVRADLPDTARDLKRRGGAALRRASALPATFFIDRDGIVRTTALGSVFGHLLEVGVADADTAGGTYE